MPGYIVKPKPDEDFYVRYSTVVDSVTHWGARLEVLASLTGYYAREADPARFDRADVTGTSAFEGDYGWDEAELLIVEGLDGAAPEGAKWGHVAREHLHTLCDTADTEGNFHPPAGLIRWEIEE